MRGRPRPRNDGVEAVIREPWFFDRTRTPKTQRQPGLGGELRDAATKRNKCPCPWFGVASRDLRALAGRARSARDLRRLRPRVRNSLLLELRSCCRPCRWPWETARSRLLKALRAALGQPGFDLFLHPNRAAGCQKEGPGKLPGALHHVDGGTRKPCFLQDLRPTDGSLDAGGGRRNRWLHGGCPLALTTQCVVEVLKAHLPVTGFP